MTELIRFEHPLSERIRNFMRLEYLFTRFQATFKSPEPWAHQYAIFTLFEIMEAAARAELKLDILQELERQKMLLSNMELWTETQKQQRLNELQTCIQDLQNVHQKFGQHLRENEWLMAIKQRILVPGGTSPFDLPSFYVWQQLPQDTRKQHLQQWIQSLLPTYNAISLLLNILRQNTLSVDCVADHGNYQHNSVGDNSHLLIIDVASDEKVQAEVSANKYFTHIRFLQISQQNARGTQSNKNIHFTLMMCSFDPVK